MSKEEEKEKYGDRCFYFGSNFGPSPCLLFLCAIYFFLTQFRVQLALSYKNVHLSILF